MVELLNLMCMQSINLNKIISQWTSWSVRQTVGREDRGSDLVDRSFRTRALCSSFFSYLCRLSVSLFVTVAKCPREKTLGGCLQAPQSRPSSLVLIAPRFRFECSPIVLVGQSNCVYAVRDRDRTITFDHTLNYKLGLLLPSI